MAKTIQEQYNQIKKGKGNKEIFLKEVKRNYPHMIVNSATFDQAEKILLQRSVLSENIAGVVNMTTKKPDWFKIFDENMNVIKEETEAAKKDEAIKAEVNKPNKDVVELETKGYDYKDLKLVDNLNGEEFRLGVKFEMDKVRNTVSDAELGDAIEKAKDVVAKNLAKDPLYYIKNAMFGVDKLGYVEDFPGLSLSKSDKMVPVKLNENKMISLVNLLENLEEKPKKKRIKKETLDSKLAEIDKASQLVAMEAKIAHIDEIIEKKQARLSMVTEDENLAELADKTKIKAMQREVKDLSKRKMKMEKLYEKMSGKKYKKPVMDEDLGSSNYSGASNSDTSGVASSHAFKNNANQPTAYDKDKVEEESNAGSNEGSNEESNYNSNENPESYSGLKKFREN